MSVIVTSPIPLEPWSSAGDIDAPTTPEAYLADSAFYGAFTSEVPIDVIHSTGAGHLVTSFRDLYYYRLWIISNTVDFGRILTEQSVQVEVWNSFFEARDFGTIVSTGDTEGLTLSGEDTAGAFSALRSRLYTLTAGVIGTPHIDVQYDWQLDGTGDTASFLQVLGSRLTAFLLRHNWAETVLEQISFRTDVLTGISGKEQRVKLRQTPRRRIEMSYLTWDGEERAYLENVLHGQNHVYAVPLWQDVSRLRTATAIGATTFAVDTVARDYEIGGMVFLHNGTDTCEILEIESFTSTHITTTQGAVNAYTTGAKVCPARFGILEDKLNIAQQTNYHETTRLAWLIDTDNDRPNQFDSYTPDTYLGLDIYDERNNYAEAVDIEQSVKSDTADNEIGLIRRLPGEPYSRRTYPHRKLIQRDEFGNFLSWFYDRGGKYTPFWWLDYTPAFHLRAGVALDSIFLTVKSNNYATLAFPNEGRRDIAIRTSTGWIYRHIEAVTDNGDGTTTLTLDTAPGVALTVNEAPQICYLRKVRLDTDTAEVVWETSDAIRTALRFIDVV